MAKKIKNGQAVVFKGVPAIVSLASNWKIDTKTGVKYQVLKLNTHTGTVNIPSDHEELQVM